MYSAAMCLRSQAMSGSRVLRQRVDLKLIQELRFRTDAPISDCNMALKECNLDLEAAAVWLRKKGIAKATKKEGRVTDNGLVIAAIDRTLGGGVITLCSETDFACRNAHFSATAVAVQAKLLDMITATKGSVMQDTDAALHELTAVCKDILASTIAVLGENLTIKGIRAVPMPPVEVETEELRQHPLMFGKYIHNSLTEKDVGGIVGLVAVRKLSESTLEPSTLDDLAQHFVGNSGDTSNYAHQSFLGTDETVSQWLKKNNVKLASSMVVPFGKEPITTFPVSRPPNAGQQKPKH